MQGTDAMHGCNWLCWITTYILAERHKSKSGKPVYNRKYRKASKKWDITPAMENKKFSYIPSLMQSILTHHKESPSP